MEGIHVITNSREVLRIVSEFEVEEYEIAPEGWISASKLAREIGMSVSKIRTAINSYRDEHPEWFKEYMHDKGVRREFYSPELVNLLSDEIKSQKDAPQGWKNLTELSKIFQNGRKALETIIDRLRTEHVDWMSNYRDNRSQVIEYYSPELVSYIQVIESEQKSAPDGWITLKPLAEIIGVDPKTLKLRLAKFRENHPEWFGNFKHERGRVFEYIAPELIELLKIEYRKF